MIDGVSPHTPEEILEALRAAAPVEENGANAIRAGDDSPGFGDMLENLLNEVDEAQKEADISIQQLAAGENTSIQDVVLKLEEADLAFRLMKEIRDKLMTAYKEILSMQA